MISVSSGPPSGPTPTEIVCAAVSGLFLACNAIREANRSMVTYHRLQAMSDDQLARRGLGRADLPGLVLREISRGAEMR